MIRYWLVFTAVFFSNCISFPVNAVEVKDLYVAKVVIESQGRTDRNKALKQALRSVLIKVGGDQSVLSHASIKAQLTRYNNFVRDYRYERFDNKQFLKASFDKAKINQLFVDANLPIWGSLRPQVVLWMVNEEGFIRQMVHDSSDSPLVDTVDNFSNERGLPIVLPTWDLTDVDKLNTSDVWGRFAQPVFNASKRYLAEAIVIIRISDNTLLSSEQLTNTADGCELLCQTAVSLDWSYLAAQDITPQFSKRYQGFDRSALLQEALSDITDDIYQRYALTTNESNQYEIDVANVDTLSRYVEISQFLQKLSSVQSVKLISADGETRRFSLTLLGSKQTLLASLKLNNTLKQKVDLFDPSLNQKVPIFYWNKF